MSFTGCLAYDLLLNRVNALNSLNVCLEIIALEINLRQFYEFYVFPMKAEEGWKCSADAEQNICDFYSAVFSIFSKYSQQRRN